MNHARPIHVDELSVGDLVYAQTGFSKTTHSYLITHLSADYTNYGPSHKTVTYFHGPSSKTLSADYRSRELFVETGVLVKLG